MNTDPVDDVVNSVIGRVAVAVVSLAAPVIAVLVAWLQAKVGINLDPAAVATLVGTVVAGVIALGYKWLHNRGEYERLILELEKLYAAGRNYMDTGEAPPAGS
jgi:high-affinity Fe2+/Pb2+ permease